MSTPGAITSAWFEFELFYPHYDVRKWMVSYRSLSIAFGIVYLGLIHCLAAWNAIMFVFSLVFVLRLASFTLKKVFDMSLHQQTCSTDFEDDSLIFWLDLFVVSKPIEFIDTLFIVLRKQPLHFLHYYHHCTVVVLCWYSLGMAPVPPNSLYYVYMNSVVHTAMYLYYLLRSIRVTVPRPLQMSITTMQILQMAIGCFINLSALTYRLLGFGCDAAYESIFLALGIYSSYAVLFANFFYKTYLADLLAYKKLRQL